MKKRVCILGLTLVLAGFLILGSFPAAMATAQDKVTLRVLLPVGGGYTIEDQKAVGQEFEQGNPNIDVQMEFVGWGQPYQSYCDLNRSR